MDQVIPCSHEFDERFPMNGRQRAVNDPKLTLSGLSQAAEVLPRVEGLAGVVDLDSNDHGVFDAKG